MALKKCSKCNELFDISFFSKDKTKHDGLYSSCNFCRYKNRKKYCDLTEEQKKKQMIATKRWQEENKEYYKEYEKKRNKKYIEEHEEEIKAYRKKYYLENREKRLQQEKERRENNREEFKLKNKKYYYDNKEELREKQRIYYREYYLKNKDKLSIKSRIRQGYIKEQFPFWSNKALINAIYSGSYILSIISGAKYEVDHIIPLRGDNVSGLHVENNLQIITAEENRAKGNRLEVCY